MEQPPASDATTDWSSLPADALTSILCCLEFPDVFSSAAVCTSWRSTARALGRLARTYTCPQTPCIFYATANGGELYSLAAGRSYRLPVPPDPPIADRYIWGESHGWLVTADTRSDLHLLNPVTADQLALPPTSTIEHVSPVLDDAGELTRYDLSYYNTAVPRKQIEPPVSYGASELRSMLYLKAVLSCDPSRSDDCIVMLIHNPWRQLSFARVGGEQWHRVETSPPNTEYSDCIYHDGAFYAMTRRGGIHRYTITAGSCASCEVIFKETLPFIAYNVYIAWTPSGDVLQVWRYSKYVPTGEGESCYDDLHTNGFEIYKLDFDKQCIVSMDSLGDNALFVGHNYTCCLSTKDYAKLLPGRVYFTDDSEYWLMDNKHSRRDVGIYNLEDDSVDDLISPQLWLNWPNPIWIRPSFTKIFQ